MSNRKHQRDPGDTGEPLLRVTRKDLDIQYFTAGGPGGQNQNKVASAVRITHRPSGAQVVCRETRDQRENRERAFRRLPNHPRFKAWLANRLLELSQHQTLEERVDEQLRQEHLQIDVRDGERWVPGSASEHEAVGAAGRIENGVAAGP